MNSVTLGGDRLGAGKKEKVGLQSYSRSTHDLGYMWKSTMGVGTLVPFMSELMLPGDSFEIKLDTDVRTIPTNGPLFGSFKTQLDVFKTPIRLYMKSLHNNKLNAGMNMNQMFLPQVTLKAVNPPLQSEEVIDYDDYQINSSAIFSYLNIRGLGLTSAQNEVMHRHFNSLPWLMYWDIYKNYYANKQEEIGAVIHTSNFATGGAFDAVVDGQGNDFDIESQSAEEIVYFLDEPGEPVFQITIVDDNIDLLDLNSVIIRYEMVENEFSAFLSSNIFEIITDEVDTMIINLPDEWVNFSVDPNPIAVRVVRRATAIVI